MAACVVSLAARRPNSTLSFSEKITDGANTQNDCEEYDQKDGQYYIGAWKLNGDGLERSR